MTRNGFLPPLTLAGLLALGFMVVWMLFSEWILGVCLYVAGSERATERLIFLLDGTPLVEVDGGDDRRNCTYRDLEGTPVPRPANEGGGWLRGTELLARHDFDGARPVGCMRSFADGRTPAGFWYYIGEGGRQGTGYFVAYDSQSKTLIGYLGTAGFRADPVPPGERFPAGAGVQIQCTQGSHGTQHPNPDNVGRAPRGSLSSWDVYVAGHDGKLYHADLQERTSEVIWQGALVVTAVVPGLRDPLHGTPHYLAVRTDDAIVLLDERGGGLNVYPIPAPLRERRLSFALTTASEAVMYWKSPADPVATEEQYHIGWVPQEGRSREATLSLEQDGNWVQLAGILFPSPLMLAGYILYERPARLSNEGRPTTYAEALADYAPALTLAQLVAAVLALACYRRQVRYGASRAERLVWPLFVLALGLPGWIGYRFGRAWPVLEACPACSAAVPRDRDACAGCAAEFPAPALKGTEVFA
jgi:hypothetical protein